MNFLEFAAWGAYLTSMVTYLVTIGMTTQIGWFYAIQGIVSIFMPALMGIVATIGTLSAQAVVNAYTVDGVTQWAACWYVFAGYALVVAVAFALIFRPKTKKHNEE